jgi:fatty acid/phospholipid biosynthesis enzyme
MLGIENQVIVKRIFKLCIKVLLDILPKAFVKALQLLIKSQKAEELAKRIDEIRKGTEAAPSVTEAVVKSHEEEDEF